MLGTYSWPPRTNGLDFLLGWRIDASTMELIFSGAFFISGSVISASKEPMRPV